MDPAGRLEEKSTLSLIDKAQLLRRVVPLLKRPTGDDEPPFASIITLLRKRPVLVKRAFQERLFAGLKIEFEHELERLGKPQERDNVHGGVVA
jgi:hypothetical protein